MYLCRYLRCPRLREAHCIPALLVQGKSKEFPLERELPVLSLNGLDFKPNLEY